MEKTEVQHQVHLDAAANLLSGDLAHLQEEASRAGLDNHLQQWIADLKAADNPSLHDIITDLQDLKAHFGGGTIDPDVVARLLHRMGDNTVKAAHFADGNTQPRVQKLGDTLLEAARTIRGKGSSAEEDLKQHSAQQ